MRSSYNETCNIVKGHDRVNAQMLLPLAGVSIARGLKSQNNGLVIQDWDKNKCYSVWEANL